MLAGVDGDQHVFGEVHRFLFEWIEPEVLLPVGRVRLRIPKYERVNAVHARLRTGSDHLKLHGLRFTRLADEEGEYKSGKELHIYSDAPSPKGIRRLCAQKQRRAASRASAR